MTKKQKTSTTGNVKGQDKVEKLIANIINEGITLEDVTKAARKLGFELSFDMKDNKMKAETEAIKKETARIKGMNDAADQAWMNAPTGKQEDPINPEHYKNDGIETIDYLRAVSTKEEFEGHCKLTAIKYISRAGKKAGVLADIDKQKAIWYLEESLTVKI